MAKIKKPLKRKVKVKETAVIPTYEKAMFYVREAAGYSLYHRLTHGFIQGFQTEQELVSFMKGIKKMSMKDLWLLLVDKHKVRIPTRKVYEQPSDHNKQLDQDLARAWYLGTNQFYGRHPELYIEEVDIPFDITNEILRSKRDASDKMAREQEREMKEREEELKVHEREKTKKKEEWYEDEEDFDGYERDEEMETIDGNIMDCINPFA